MSIQYLYQPKPVAPTNYVLSVDAEVAPIALTEVKDHLRICHDDFDDQLIDLIMTATEYGEKITGRDFINKTYITYLDCFPACDLPIKIQKSKLQSITSIQYYVNNVLTTLDAGQYYITDEADYATINLFDGNSYPTDEDARKQAVVITFVAGFGAAATDVPEAIRRAMLGHITSLFENPGDCADDCGAGALPDQSKTLYKACTITSSLFDVC
jgi:uncharacterized phiE125 gp8 family phage protein